MKTIIVFVWVTAFIVSGCGIARKGNQGTAAYKFDFGSGPARAGYTRVTPGMQYNDSTGYGFEATRSLRAVEMNGPQLRIADYITADGPFFFSVKLPEGNYDVTVTTGDKSGTSVLAVRAESRRMMVEKASTDRGAYKDLDFTVHIRDTVIRGTDKKVRIKPRERTSLHWDNKLTLEFNGEQPKVNAITIRPAQKDVITVFLAGNSTVVDQGKEPYAAWGQMIPAFFQPGKVSIANYAESGESLSSFISARRLEKMLSLMKAGDYAFVEFGHNDQKQTGAGIGAFTSYKKDLTFFISEVRKKGGIPVLVTSVQRRSFDSAGRIMHTLGDYPDAVRQTSKEQNTALIDLNALTKTLYETWGPERSIKAFVHYPAHTFPAQDQALKDNTHYNAYGAYEIARCVVLGIQAAKLELARYLKKNLAPFDPAKSETAANLYWPLSPSMDAIKPDGN